MQKKPDFVFNQSAVIPYFIENGVTKIVLITSSKKKKWIIPKGVIEKNMTPWDSAAKEAFEESGVEGKVQTQPIGEYQKEKWGGVCNITVFLLEVTRNHEHWDEAHKRDRKILKMDDAIALVDHWKLKNMIALIAEPHQ